MRLTLHMMIRCFSIHTRWYFQEEERQKRLRERARRLIAEARAGLGKTEVIGPPGTLKIGTDGDNVDQDGKLV